MAATWVGILLTYDSYYWGNARQGLPVSFFIVAVVFVAYLLSGLRGRWPVSSMATATATSAAASPDQIAA